MPVNPYYIAAGATVILIICMLILIVRKHRGRIDKGRLEQWVSAGDRALKKQQLNKAQSYYEKVIKALEQRS